MTEEQLIEIFSEVGQVAKFRLVFDKDTGKPKGYGFCEYSDSDTAASAVRNLDKYEANGRSLRVHFAEHDLMGRPFQNAPGDASALEPTNNQSVWSIQCGMACWNSYDLFYTIHPLTSCRTFRQRTK